ncbi:unnamed protein product [marine sediment metagenome]|uniref:Uncharacterized protein n=1 Tax=marine sediment metagenome TaxID=412755 RepID=X1AJ34_9ZZZZ
MHRDCLSLRVAAYVEDHETVSRILDKYKLVSSTQLESLRDEAIKNAIIT